MSLEKIEEKCLHYLGEASNPLVPIETLRQFCQRDPECGKISRQELLDFLRPHALVTIMDGPSMDAVVTPADFQSAGINMGQRAILNSRAPSNEEMTEMLFEQLKDLTDVLVESLDKAKKAKQSTRAEQLEAALHKAEGLRQKMTKML